MKMEQVVHTKRTGQNPAAQSVQQSAVSVTRNLLLLKLLHLAAPTTFVLLTGTHAHAQPDNSELLVHNTRLLSCFCDSFATLYVKPKPH